MLFLECIVLIALSKITLFLIHIIRSHYNLINYFKFIYYLFWYIILSYFLHFISTSITLYYCCCDCPYYVKHLEISLYFKVCYTNKIHYYYYYYYTAYGLRVCLNQAEDIFSYMLKPFRRSFLATCLHVYCLCSNC